MIKFIKNFLKRIAFNILNIDQEYYDQYRVSYENTLFINKEDPLIYKLNNHDEFIKAKILADNFFKRRYEAVREFCQKNINNDEKTDESGVVAAARSNSFAAYGQQLTNFINNYSGTGGALDMNIYDQRIPPTYEFQEIYSTFYQTSPIAKRLVDILTSSCLADGFEFISSAETQKEQIEEIKKLKDYMKKKRINRIFYGSVKKMFMHGGCAIYIKVSGDQSQPYYPKKGDNPQFLSIDKSLMFPSGFFDLLNIGSPDFNHPTHWNLIFNSQFGNQSQPIHASRFIFLIPEELPFYARINALWWGNSVLFCVKEIINIVERSTRSTGNQISQASMAILKTALRNRAVNPRSIQNQNSQFQTALTQNGSLNAFDVNDVIERLEVKNLKDQAEAIKIIESLVCTTHGIPWAIFDSYPLVGSKASDADLLIWYKQVMLNKENYIHDPFNQLVEILSTILFGDKERISFMFNDPNAPSELQKADIELKDAQRETMHAKLGLPVSFIFREVARKKLYPDLTQEDAETIIMPIEGGEPMEGKDIKDDLDRRKKPTDAAPSASPESITSEALYK